VGNKIMEKVIVRHMLLQSE